MKKFTAIDPAGVTHKRTSANRIYTHTVVGLPSSVKHAQLAMSVEARKMHRANFVYHSAYINGTGHWLMKKDWESEVERADRDKLVVDAATKALKGCSTADAYEAMKIDEALDLIKRRSAAGYYDAYQNFGWCGRYDLAAKLKSSSEGKDWLDVVILEASMKG